MGQATIDLPEHFALVASEKELTGQLTPRSSLSKGLAIVKLTPQQLIVAELDGQQGGYEFDYMIYGQRAGKEGFRVLRPHLKRDLSEKRDVAEKRLIEEVEEVEDVRDLRAERADVSLPADPQETPAPDEKSQQTEKEHKR
jgi:hypothetical protein